MLYFYEPFLPFSNFEHIFKVKLNVPVTKEMIHQKQNISSIMNGSGMVSGRSFWFSCDFDRIYFSLIHDVWAQMLIAQAMLYS